MPTSPTATGRKIEHLALHDLVPDPVNPKHHDLDLLNASVDRFGLIELIIRDERTGKIISGHGRCTTLRAMQERGDQPPDGVSLAEDGTWQVPVVTGWASSNDTEAQAALVALNRTTERGGWLDDQLHTVLSDLSQTTPGLTGIGFDRDDLRQLQKDLAELDEDIPTDDVLGEDLSYRIMIECRDQSQQSELLGKLEAEGLNARPLIS